MNDCFCPKEKAVQKTFSAQNNMYIALTRERKKMANKTKQEITS